MAAVFAGQGNAVPGVDVSPDCSRWPPERRDPARHRWPRPGSVGSWGRCDTGYLCGILPGVLLRTSSGSLKAGLLSVRKFTFHFFLYLHCVVLVGVHVMQVPVRLHTA